MKHGWSKGVGVGLMLLGGSVLAATTESQPSPASVSQSDARTPPGITPLLEFAPEGNRISAQARENGNSENLRQQRLAPLRQAAKVCAGKGIASGASAAEQTWVLGLLTLHGYVGLPDKVTAEQLFQTAWQCGFPMATAGLAWCATVGCGGRPSQAQALRWTDGLLRVNAGRALYLRWWITRGSASMGVTLPPTSPDPAGAVAGGADPDALLKQAADLGDVQALNEMGMQMAASGQLDQALALFIRASDLSAAARDNASAIRQQIAVKAALQRWSLSPLPGEPSLGAVRRDAQAADAGDSLYQMARRFHRGEGVAVNYPEAIRWYRAAWAAGHLEAARMLEQIYSKTDPSMGLNAEWMAQLANAPYRTSAKGNTIGVPGLLHRDETPLSDLIPAGWRP